MITYIYYAHLASVRFEHSVCRGSLMTTYIYIHILRKIYKTFKTFNKILIHKYFCVWDSSEARNTKQTTKYMFFLFFFTNFC